ncbi:MAG: hypothetical protein JXA87_12420 [Thermoleophilia bacterium]|nr:hypothetical protein [Thermoleophilia bacterium]
MAWREKNRHENELPPCPFCESDRVIPVLYGLPTREAFELADGGELVLGGCTVTGLNAHWACSTCGRQW